MKFNLTAAKAYVGGVAAAALVSIGPGVVKLVDGIVQAGFGLTVPDGVNGLLLGALAYITAHIAVYITPNKTA